MENKWELEAKKKSEDADTVWEPLRSIILIVLDRYPQAFEYTDNEGRVLVLEGRLIERLCPECGHRNFVLAQPATMYTLGMGNSRRAAWEDSARSIQKNSL